MVVNRSEFKRRRKDGSDVLRESPKRTKVHAQRKFAQGSSTVTSPTLTPVKDKVKVNGSAPPADLLPAKRPHTEDFLTFLCFRGTRILPPRLNFFNTAAVPEALDDDVTSAAGSSRTISRQNKNSEQIPNNAVVDRGRNNNKPTSAQDRAAKALKKKYLEQRIAKQKKTSLTNPVETTGVPVKEDRLSKTRSSARAAELEQKRKRNARIMAYNKARKAVITSKPAKPIVKRKLKSKQLRVGLRSGGQLPPGSDLGLKNPIRKTKGPVVPTQQAKKDKQNEKTDRISSSPEKKSIKGKEKVLGSKLIATSLSDFSSDDDQPLVKKSRNAAQARQLAKAKSPTLKERLIRSKHHQATASTSGVTNRPSRRTKEAAAVYMEMLGKDLRSPDEDYDDDAISVESFPELPNKKKSELREKEFSLKKALADKNQPREETRTKKIMRSEASGFKAERNIVKPVLSSKIDDRNRRLQLRNKAKGKYLKERRKKDALRKRRAILAVRAAKQRASRLIKEKAIKDEDESDYTSKTTSPVRGIESRRSSLALRQASEKLAEYKLRKQPNTPEKGSPVRAPSEKSVSSSPKKQQQLSHDKNPKKLAPNEKRSSVAKNIVDKFQSTDQKKSGKSTPKKVLSNEPNKQTVDKNVKDNQSLLNSQKKQPVEKNASSKKSVDQPKKSLTQSKSTDEEEFGLANSRNASPSRKPTDVVPKNSLKTSSVSKKKKSVTKGGGDGKSSDNYSDSDEEPLTNLTKKLDNKKDENVGVSKSAVTAKNEITNTVKNDIQSKPPKQRKQKSPQKKCVDTGSERTYFDAQSSKLNIERIPQGSKSNPDLGKRFDGSSKDVSKEVYRSETNVKICDNKTTKSNNGEVIKVESVREETPLCNKKEPSKTLSSNQVKNDASTNEIPNDTVPISTVRDIVSLNTSFTENVNKLETLNKLVNSEESSLIKSDKISNIKGSSNEVKKNNENEVQTQSSVEKCSIDYESSKKQSKDLVQSTKVMKVENNSLSNKSSTDKKLEDPVQSFKRIKIENSTALDESQVFEKSSKDMTQNSRNVKLEKNSALDESTANKKPNKDCIQITKPIKVEKSLTPVESSLNKKSDVTQSTKPVKVEKVLIPDESNKNSMKDSKQAIRIENNSSTNEVKKSFENTSSQSKGIVASSDKKEECFNKLSVSEKTLSKPNLPAFKSEATRTSPVNSSGALSSQSRSNIVLDRHSDVLKAIPILKEDTKPVAVSNKQIVRPEVKPAVKEDIKQILFVATNLGLDKGSGETGNNASNEVDSSVNVNVGKKEVGVSERNDCSSFDSIRPGSDKSSKDSNLPQNLNVLTAPKTPVKLNHILPVSLSPVNPQRMLNVASRANVKPNEVKKPLSRQSVNDTWRQAFKNAKIPKPGQSSPVMSDEKPFVRKPFTSHALKKQINFDSRTETTASTRSEVVSSTSSINLISPFAVNRKPFVVTSTGPIGSSNVVTTSSVMPVVTVTMSTKDSVVSIPISACNEDDSTRVQRTIDPDELRLKEAEIVEDIVRMYGVDYEGSHKNLLIGCAPKPETKPFSQPIVPQTTFNSSTTTERGKKIITFTTRLDNQDAMKNMPEPSITPTKASPPEATSQSISPAKPIPSTLVASRSPEVSKPSGPGKHHNLPLPVEQTLKKLQTKSVVTKKPPVKNLQDQLLRKQQSISDKNLVSASSSSACPPRNIDNSSSFLSEFPSSSSSSLLNKKKVNMSTEEIKKWLNDSTSTGIEHTKDCGIFEKNECECGPSFGDDNPPEPETLSVIPLEDDLKTSRLPEKNKDGNEADRETSNKSFNIVDTPKPKEVEDESIVVVDNAIKAEGNVFKQQSSSKTSNEVFSKTSDEISQKVDKFEGKGSSRTKDVEKTPVKGECNESSEVGDIKKMKSNDSLPSPSAHFSPPLSLVPLSQQRDETSSNDDSPEKSSSSSAQHERRSIFHQRRSVFRSRPALSRSPSAFSPENESSVYAFEPDLPLTSTPFRRAKGAGSSKEGRTSNATTDDEDAGLSSNSIAVQVNIDSEDVLECSTQTDDDDGEGHLFYIPIQRNNTENVVGSGSGQQVIQGVAVKLGTEGPDQRVIMSAKLVTKPRSTFPSTSTSRPLISRGESIGVSCKPEQKVKPLTMSSTHALKPPVGTVQPTARVTATCQIPTVPETLRSQKSFTDSATLTNMSSRDVLSTGTDTEETAVSKMTSQSTVDSAKKIDKEMVAADRPKKEADKTTSSNVSAASPATADKTRPVAAVGDQSQSDKNDVTNLSIKGTQCDKSDVTNLSIKGTQCDSSDRSPTPPPTTDRRRKAHQAVTSSTFFATSERGRGRGGRKKSPVSILGKKARKSSPALSGSSSLKDSDVAGPSSKAKRSKGRGAGMPSDSSGMDGRPNLEEAPAFYPTEKEFQDPLEYIEKIRPLAEKYGICKVIPPANFKPECKVSDDMRFTAYNQYVHKMQERWGPNVKEMLAIRRHLATQSIAMTQPPWIGGMEVDLPRLYQTVQNCGGLREVIEKKRWTRVADAMRIPKFAQDRVTKLDDIYCKFLLPYDTLSHDERTKLFQSVELEWERRMLKHDYDGDDEDDDDDSDSDDSCNLEECIVKGKTMALSGFYRIARNTMAVHFRNNDSPSPAEVETEFWNHVANRQHHVCVHSGSIDSGAFGYGFPIVKNSATSKHPWNLKVLTNNAGTILRSLGPLMGVTVPTLHVGMVFSACCWYRDPHGLPWIEYLHTGKSKIWYGIADRSSAAFREAMAEVVPRLCLDKRLWLASDTAMVSPHLLASRGVQLCRTVQEPGQFIVVFPKAFTSSICTGYLVSESVYFAQPSWLATAHSVFKDISDSCEPSMFSLERLLFSIASDARSHYEVLSQVLPMVEEIKESELNQRFELEKLGLSKTERILLSKARGKSRLAHEEDGDYECEICRANLFLSVVTNSQDDGVYCLKHAIEHIKQKPGDLKHCSLLYTYSSDEFDELIEKMKARMEQKSQKKQQNKSAIAGSSSTSKTDQH